MALVRESRLYDAYCNFCFYTGQKHLSEDKWRKRFHNSSIKQSRTVEDIQKELEEIREYS